MNRILQFILAVFFLAYLSACNPNLVFEKYHSLPERTWDRDSVVVFNLPVTDTISNYNIFLNVRNDMDYAYSNLWLFIEIQQPGGEVLEDKLEITLADPSGRWLGEGFGGLKTVETLFRENVFFPVSGNYTIRVKQGMRENKLEEISDIGVRVEKVE